MGEVRPIRKNGASARSGLGMSLSKVSGVLPKFVTDRTGDVGFWYDRKKPSRKAVVLATAAAVVVGAAFSVAKSVESQESAALTHYQDGVVVGRHPLVSFEVKEGTANVRSHAAKGGEDVIVTMKQGQSVMCAPEVKTEDGRGNLTTWVMVRDDGGRYGFVNVDQNPAVKLVDTPSGCPNEGLVSVKENGNFGPRYTVEVEKGLLLPNAGVIQG